MCVKYSFHTEIRAGTLVNEVMTKMWKEHLLKEKHLFMFITSNIRRLTLLLSSDDAPALCHLVSAHCKDSLKELEIHQNYIDKPEVYMEMLRSLNGLEILNLTWANVDDDVLSILGSSCPRLRELNVSGSHEVTDKGIKYLCVDDLSSYGGETFVNNRLDSGCAKLFGHCVGIKSVEKQDSIPYCGNWKYGKCKLLTCLDLATTEVTHSGIEIALRCLPNLQHLGHSQLLYTLGTMHEIDWKAGESLPTYRLRDISIDFSCAERYISVYLSVAVDVCPFITDVDISNFWLNSSPNVLKPLCKLRNMKVLTHNNFTTWLPSPSFELVVPVLKECSRTLTGLHLAGLIKIDIGVIGWSCHVLERLTIGCTDELIDVSTKESHGLPSGKRPFSSLKKLKVGIYKRREYMDTEVHERCDIPRRHLKDLLSTPSLETVEIRGSLNLNFDLLSEVLNQGQTFSHLKTLKLLECHNLTPDFIHALLHLPGPLEFITLHYCGKINQSDFDSFESVIQGRNLDVEIT